MALSFCDVFVDAEAVPTLDAMAAPRRDAIPRWRALALGIYPIKEGDDIHTFLTAECGKVARAG
jgi:hypothetical protein